ncbi:hypothetical protein [Streptomyces morookaense]|uniref:Uncharacterized protein n=1 Tax=Streptomyces morookaense TaxID=1970 RepID=A0A7Y7B746_STRMO|nr:hypothetical protein [Streptomyces morookaense]NVK80064.1 hypothetical protein [Streptomyces morookaense]
MSTATLFRSNTRLHEAALTVCGRRKDKTKACAPASARPTPPCTWPPEPP